MHKSCFNAFAMEQSKDKTGANANANAAATPQSITEAASAGAKAKSDAKENSEDAPDKKIKTEDLEKQIADVLKQLQPAIAIVPEIADFIRKVMKGEDVDINKQFSSDKVTLLHTASSYGVDVLVEAILKYPKVDVSIRDNYGDVALSLGLGYITDQEIFDQLLAKTELSVVMLYRHAPYDLTNNLYVKRLEQVIKKLLVHDKAAIAQYGELPAELTRAISIHNHIVVGLLLKYGAKANILASGQQVTLLPYARSLKVLHSQNQSFSWIQNKEKRELYKKYRKKEDLDKIIQLLEEAETKEKNEEKRKAETAAKTKPSTKTSSKKQPSRQVEITKPSVNAAACAIPESEQRRREEQSHAAKEKAASEREIKRKADEAARTAQQAQEAEEKRKREEAIARKKAAKKAERPAHLALVIPELTHIEAENQEAKPDKTKSKAVEKALKAQKRKRRRELLINCVDRLGEKQKVLMAPGFSQWRQFVQLQKTEETRILELKKEKDERKKLPLNKFGERNRQQLLAWGFSQWKSFTQEQSDSKQNAESNHGVIDLQLQAFKNSLSKLETAKKDRLRNTQRINSLGYEAFESGQRLACSMGADYWRVQNLHNKLRILLAGNSLHEDAKELSRFIEQAQSKYSDPEYTDIHRNAFALMDAIKAGDNKALAEMVHNGNKEHFNCANEFGQTPLTVTQLFDNKEAIKLLGS